MLKRLIFYLWPVWEVFPLSFDVSACVSEIQGRLKRPHTFLDVEKEEKKHISNSLFNAWHLKR
jgi:hypothetical protein